MAGATSSVAAAKAVASTDSEEKATGGSWRAPKLDPHGFALRPQPSDDPLDPLNWNRWLKLGVLFQVSFLAFLGPFTGAVINVAFRPLATDLHIGIVEASYQTTITILFAGVSPILWSPIANVYGRRPIFVFVTAIGVAAHCASAAAQTWGGIMAARAFVGIGTSAGMGIGAAAVADMYFMHERGRYMGFFVVFVTNGAHVAAIVGGYIAEDIGWRWCYWIPGIVFGITWLVLLLALPETIYHRNNTTGESLEESSGSWVTKFNFSSLRGGRDRRLRSRDFLHVFHMLRYPSVLLPALYYSIAFGTGSVLFSVTGAAAFGEIYRFNPAQVGLAVGWSTFVGTLIGEIFAGPVSDGLLLFYTKHHHGEPQLEARLQAIWPGFFLCPIGVIIEGVCFQYEVHWSGPVLGIGIAAVGLQIISTNVYAYMTDCYRPQSAEISTLLNFGRQVFSFTLSFYMIPFAHKTTYGVAWSVLAIIHASLFTGPVILMWKGKGWRERLGTPNFHENI